MASTANGLNILDAVFHMPRKGVWHGELLLDTTDRAKASAKLTCSLTGGSLVLIGTPIRPPIIWNGHAKCRIAAGNAALDTILQPQGYNGITAKAVLGDIAVGAGETISSTINASLLQTTFPQYVRLGQSSAGFSIEVLARELGVVWRSLPDGSIWLGTESWPALDPTNVDILAQDSAHGTMTVGVNTFTALPGMTFGGYSIGRCTHRLMHDRLRTDFIFDDV